MLVDHEKDEDEEHGEVHGSTDGLKVSHRQRNLAGSLFVFLNRGEVTSLLVNVTKYFSCQHVPNVFYLINSCEDRRNSLFKFVVRAKLCRQIIARIVDNIVRGILRDIQQIVDILCTI